MKSTDAESTDNQPGLLDNRPMAMWNAVGYVKRHGSEQVRHWEILK